MRRQSIIERLYESPPAARVEPEHGLLHVGEVRQTLVAVRDPGCRTAECLRGVAMRLMAASGTRDRSRRLAVVSPGRRDGRSFIAANLAAIFAQAGQRTLLVDADLRTPGQHKLFQCDIGPGLTALLRNQGDESLARPVDGVPGLRVITAGDMSSADDDSDAASTQATSLSGERFETLLSNLRSPVDQIIIDTPAGADYADAETIAARTGAALMIMRRDVTRLSAARQLANSIDATGARIMGTIVNRR